LWKYPERIIDVKNTWLPEIDNLRAFAILGVIYIHAFGIIPAALVNVIAIVEENHILMAFNQYVESISDFAVPCLSSSPASSSRTIIPPRLISGNFTRAGS